MYYQMQLQWNFFIIMALNFKHGKMYVHVQKKDEQDVLELFWQKSWLSWWMATVLEDLDPEQQPLTNALGCSEVKYSVVITKARRGIVLFKHTLTATQQLTGLA